ncbi:NAD(P)/FAD-dependent oxidoreductase [Pseudonocardia sp.]|uniref:NAD(P)/FAD-dependent oxidoreductase n=1 Tax=Pseudonocardia sp. TaxID=60912 RepID=UPI003D0F46B9
MTRTTVVIGASIAGMLAAAAASRRSDRVLVLEHDDLPDRPQGRPGTPQAPHTHGLLASGRAAMEEILPGLTEDLVGAGALAGGDAGRAGRWWIGGGLIADCDLGLGGAVVSRPTLEHAVRVRVQKLCPAVEIHSEADVVGLLGDAGRVTGVAARARGAGATTRRIEADVVIDASGRAGRAMRWLPAVGAVAPREERVQVGVRYATVHVASAPEDLGGRVVVVCAATREVPRGGVAIRQEDATWILTLFSYGDTAIPSDTDGLRRFAATLVSPDLTTLLADRDPLHAPLAYRFPDCRRRRVEEVDLPLGYAPIGDAVASFDPTFGQGMTVAALQALALRDALAGGPEQLRGAYVRRATGIVDRAWTVVVGAVVQLPGVSGPAPAGHAVMSRYVRRLQRVARHDPQVARAFLRVTNLIDPPQSLMRPALAARVLRPGAA